LTNNIPGDVTPHAWVGITSVTFNQTAFIATGGVYVFYAADLVTLSFPNLTTITTINSNSFSPTSFLSPLFDIQDNLLLTTVDLPVLNAVGGFREAFLSIRYNPALTNINMPAFLITSPLVNVSLRFEGNALSQSCVDSILARADLCPVPSNVKTVALNGGTNSTPSAGGLASKASLVGKGWTVLNN
jgi:hypothetical protein